MLLLLWNHDQYITLPKVYMITFLIDKNNILEEWLFYKEYTTEYLSQDLKINFIYN